MVGVLALLMRAELPGQARSPCPEQYDQLFTMHRTITLLSCATPARQRGQALSAHPRRCGGDAGGGPFHLRRVAVPCGVHVGIGPWDTVVVLVDRVFTPRPGGAGERERWSVTATRFNLVAAGEVTGGVGTRHQFRPVTSKRKVQFVALGTEVLLRREWVRAAELPAVVAAAFTAAATNQPTAATNPVDS